MTLTVLVPLDGSPLAERALPFAAGLVSRVRGDLVLVHVRPQRRTGAPLGYDLSNVVDRLCDAGVIAGGRSYLAPPDEVADVLRSAVNETAADLIVMSTHGRGGLQRSIVGSVADQLVRRAEVPVLLIPPNCEATWPDRSVAQILVPLDGSRLAETALYSAASLAERLGAELLLVQTVSPVLHARHRDNRLILSCADFIEIEDAWRYLSTVADRLRTAGRQVCVRVLVGAAADAIASAARDGDVDLIAMTTHGRGGFGRLLLGSVADGVLRRSGVPVLLVRSDMPVCRSVAPSSANASA
jgi:nucleotide-binding universal stress UspA family protein